MAEVFDFDCYAARQIAGRVGNVDVTKANLPLFSQVALGVLAGGVIGLGAMSFTLAEFIVAKLSLSDYWLASQQASHDGPKPEQIRQAG